MSYTKTDWNDDASPPISAENLDKIEAGVAVGVGYTIDEIRALPAPTYYRQVIHERGAYIWDPASTAADDDGHILKITSESVGRYIKEEKEVGYPSAFGGGEDGLRKAMAACLSIKLDEDIQIDDSSLTMLSKQCIDLNGYTITNNTGGSVFSADALSNIKIHNGYINGDNTEAVGSDSAIYITNTDGYTVDNIVFDNIGTEDGYSSCVGVRQSTNGIIKNNKFLEGNRSATGADIGMGYACSHTLVSGNISKSNNDSFISCSSVTYADYDTSFNVITSNIGYRADGNSCRSAIIGVYGASTGNNVISNNILIGWQWCGIYVSAAITGYEDSAQLIINSNKIYNCGGDDIGNSSLISAGIYVSGEGGGIVTNNYVKNSGYNLDGTLRTSPSSGIGVYYYARDWIISDNIIKNSVKNGFEILTNNSILENILVRNNLIVGNLQEPIAAKFSGASDVKNIEICGNVLKCGADTHGLYYTFVNSGSATKGCKIKDNSITGFDASTKKGIYYLRSGDEFDVLCAGNTIDTFVDGFATSTLTADKVLGEKIIVENNLFKNISAFAIACPTNSLSGLEFGNSFVNVTTPRASNVYAAKRLNGVDTYSILSSAAPVGTWAVGSKYTPITPIAGGSVGSVYTASGWKSEGTIEI